MASVVMQKGTARFGTGAAVAAVAMLICGPAEAVDVINRDKQPREIVVNDSDGQSSEITLKPQQKIANVCTACVILTGDTSVEASGDQTVMIEGGKVSVGSKR